MRRLKHCAEERLLALIDGELGPVAAWLARRHLARCWECRARRDELERRAYLAVELLNDPAFLGPARIARARWRVLARTRAWELERYFCLYFINSYYLRMPLTVQLKHVT